MGTTARSGQSSRSCTRPGGSAGLTAPFSDRWMGPFTSSGRPKGDSDVASDPAMDSRMNPRRHNGECRVVDSMQRNGRHHTAEPFPHVAEHQRGQRYGQRPDGRLGREVQRDEAGGRPQIRLRDGTDSAGGQSAAAGVPGSRRGTPVPRRSAAEPRRRARHSSRRPVACDRPASGPAANRTGTAASTAATKCGSASQAHQPGRGRIMPNSSRKETAGGLSGCLGMARSSHANRRSTSPRRVP